MAFALDVRDLAPKLRHAKIFETLDALRPGDAFVLVNDHDPRPLFYQLQAERPGAFGWTYLEQGPDVWRVEIGRSPDVRAGGAPCPAPAPAGGAPRPAQLAEAAQVPLDVREDIRKGAEPFARIMAAVKDLGERQVLVLRVPFEPVPLYDVLGKRGFAHWTERHAADDWSVWFYRGGTAAAAPPRIVDVRGLEPPQPMVAVLGALDRLRPGERLEVLHDRRPMLLYPMLDERGFAHTTDESEPGVVRIVIERGVSA